MGCPVIANVTVWSGDKKDPWSSGLFGMLTIVNQLFANRIELQDVNIYFLFHLVGFGQ